jgi:hypothetical protein
MGSKKPLTAGTRMPRSLMRATGITGGRDYYELAALACNVKRLPGRAGNKRRDKKLGILSDAIRRAGKNPTAFWAPLASPKRKR